MSTKPQEASVSEAAGEKREGEAPKLEVVPKLEEKKEQLETQAEALMNSLLAVLKKIKGAPNTANEAKKIHQEAEAHLQTLKDQLEGVLSNTEALKKKDKKKDELLSEFGTFIKKKMELFEKKVDKAMTKLKSAEDEDKYFKEELEALNNERKVVEEKRNSLVKSVNSKKKTADFDEAGIRGEIHVLNQEIYTLNAKRRSIQNVQKKRESFRPTGEVISGTSEVKAVQEPEPKKDEPSVEVSAEYEEAVEDSKKVGSFARQQMTKEIDQIKQEHGEMKVGDSITWIAQDGKPREGVIGDGKTTDTNVFVKTEKQKSGFALPKNKAELSTPELKKLKQEIANIQGLDTLKQETYELMMKRKALMTQGKRSPAEQAEIKELEDQIRKKDKEIADIEDHARGLDNKYKKQIADAEKSVLEAKEAEESAAAEAERQTAEAERQAAEAAEIKEAQVKAERKQKLAKANSFEDLEKIVEEMPETIKVGDKSYSRESLLSALGIMKGKDVSTNSPLVNEFPAVPGLKEKVVQILNRENVENRRKEYAGLEAEFVKKYRGLSAVRRLVDSGGYNQLLEKKTSAFEAYKAERAELVKEDVMSLLNEQMAMGDAKAEAFQNEKGWGTKLYDKYKKLGKARLVIGAGLMAGGFALGAVAAPAGVIAGVVGARRLLGGIGSGVGTYDVMSLAGEKFSSPVQLGEKQKEELNKFKNKEQITAWKKFRNKEGAGEKFKKKQDELQSQAAREQAPNMSEMDLQEALGYYEAALVMKGQKPSENPTYRILLEERAKRYKVAVEEHKSADKVEKQEDKEDILVLETKRRQGELIGQEVQKSLNYLKQAMLITLKYHKEMTAVKGEKEDKKNSPEYKRWMESRKELEQMMGSLSPDVQVFIDKHGKGRLQPQLDMIVAKNYEKWRDKKADEIDETELWEDDWKYDVTLQKELETILSNNELIKKQSEEEVVTAMEDEATFTEKRKELLGRKKSAVMSFLDAEMDRQDAEIDESRDKAIYKESAKKVIATGVGVIVGSGLIYQWLRGDDALAAGGTQTEISPDQIKPKGPPFDSLYDYWPDLKNEISKADIEYLKEQGILKPNAGIYGLEVPEVESTGGVIDGSQGSVSPDAGADLGSAVDSPGSGVTEGAEGSVNPESGADLDNAIDSSDSGAVEGSEGAASPEAGVAEGGESATGVESADKVGSDLDSSGAEGMEPTYEGSSIEFGPGQNSIHSIMDKEVLDHGREMFPKQWNEALLEAKGDTIKAEKLFGKFTHDWKMTQLRDQGFDWIKHDGQWHYGYPAGSTPHPGDAMKMVQDPKALGGWKIDLSYADKIDADPSKLRFPSLGEEAWADGELKTVYGETVKAPPFTMPTVPPEVMHENVNAAISAKASESNALAEQLRAAAGKEALDLPKAPAVVGESASIEAKNEFLKAQERHIQMQKEVLADMQAAKPDVLPVARPELRVPSGDEVTEVAEKPEASAPITEDVAEVPSDEGIRTSDVVADADHTVTEAGGVRTETTRSVYEGRLYGVTTRSLVKEGILAEDWSKQVRIRGGLRDIARKSALATARSLHVQKVAISDALEAGDTAKADRLRSAYEKTLSFVKRRNPGVFK
jgi:hypothetical protein